MQSQQTIEEVAADKNLCGEGPIWDPRRRRLIWNDLTSKLVYHYFPETGEKEIITRDLMAAGIALTDGGDDLVYAGATGMHLWNPSGQCTTFLTAHEGESLFLNDIIADAQGRVYAGTCYWGASGMEKLGKLYLIDNAGRARVVADGIELANGLGFSPDDRKLYFADSTARRIYAFDIDAQSGELSRKRVFVQIPLDEGIPDGLTVDSDGHVWSAQVYGSQIVRYDPDGKVERRVALPVRQITSVMFGGDDYRDLYITSASEPWPGPHTPTGYDNSATNIGGSLYRTRIEDAQGRPEYVARIKP